MATDRPILVAGQGPVPATYNVPNAQEIIPLAINAVVDGTAASGPFVPTIEILSDGGIVIARIPCSTTIQVGGTAEVTWAPFLRGAAGGGVVVYDNGVQVGTEPGLDFQDSASVTWTVTDVPASSWVQISAKAGAQTTSGQGPGSYTWVNPGSGTVSVICVGAGGGGGCPTSGGNIGGGGGGGGAVTQGTFLCSTLPANVVYNVGAGGLGATVANTQGGDGTRSNFGIYLFAGSGGGGGIGSVGGGGGGAVTSAVGTGAGTPNTGGTNNPPVNGIGPQCCVGGAAHTAGGNTEWGGASGVGGADVAANGSGGGSSLYGGRGGGGGGTSAGGDTVGCAGGGQGYTWGLGGAPGRPGQNGSSVLQPYTGTGGGGGSYLAASPGANGGNGGPGCGGGGASTRDVGQPDGHGGNGGDGAVYIITNP